ncbi:hypothetical protein CTEN210_15899 [Chaetoceros tenuissimus]|uniref:Uncharacterized protein n=1 Tax=Chaetoceros tenuissimus TaxID=426638 RepID=A0AAD3D7V7_9STRA|nr:hypothetical protein CTEN210_15899 [Chaetoceros tenuissimus]
MRIQTEEWTEIMREGPGVRMYKGKKTLFYNGEILWEYSDDWETFGPLVYDYEERDTWQVIVVLPGVEMIPGFTFYRCRNIKKVIMADTVKGIQRDVFYDCWSLVFVKLSTDLEFIGVQAFIFCSSLTSIFIPPSCREIGFQAFRLCKKLIIIHVPHQTQLDRNLISETAMEVSPFTADDVRRYQNNKEVVDQWIKDINIGEDDEYVLHRACSSFNPLEEIIYAIVRQHGLSWFQKKNRIGITPSQYLDANPFSKVKEQKIVNRYVLEMMGEVGV